MVKSKTPSIIDLARNAGDELRTEYVKISELAGYFLEGNSKLHDIGDLTEKFQKYGFVEAIKVDPSLNAGNGGIVGGNGRLETLIQMFESGMDAPRGIKVDGDRSWYAPVSIGVNAKDEREAIALSIDLNWSVLNGGNFTALDGTKLFDTEALLAQLQDLADNGEMVTSIDTDDLDFLLEQLQAESAGLDFDGEDSIGSGIPSDNKPIDEESLSKTKHKCPSCGFQW